MAGNSALDPLVLVPALAQDALSVGVPDLHVPPGPGGELGHQAVPPTEPEQS